MPKSRQLRINDLNKIREQVQTFAGKKLNVVLRDDRVIVGTLIDIQNDYVTIRNMRLRPMEFRFDDVAEIYFDTID